MYKTSLAFKTNELFLTEDGWHKMLNITLLLHFCSLMIFLAQVPKEYQGYLLGCGLLLIMIIEEKDFLSVKYALIPIAFNNLLLIVSQFLRQRER